MEHPEKYPQLTIRVSGYAVNFVRLTREQQLDVIRRTFHAHLLRSGAMSGHRHGGGRQPLRPPRPASSPDAPDTERLRRARSDASAGCTPTRPARRWTVRACGSCSSCPAACCAASICHNPDTWHLKDGTRIELAHAVRRLGDFAPALRAMGGGLTISGGEPLVQIGFTRGLFAAAKRMGLHTALDTSGFLGHRADDDYLANVDLVLLDIKSGDPDTYRKVTGVELAADAALRRAPERDGKAGLGPLRAGAGPDRRSRQHREGRALRRADEECGMGRGAALPPDGRLQVEDARARLQLADTPTPTRAAGAERRSRSSAAPAAARAEEGITACSPPSAT